jgi:hypothetical protein
MKPALATPVLLLAALAPAVSAQVTWSHVGLTARSHHAMVTDTVRSRVVLYGGTTSDTHEWDGTSWVAARPAHRPPTRTYAAMAFDFLRGRTVLFGGGPQNNQTWEWDGTDWTQLVPASSPPGRNGTRLAYDLGRFRTVLFGGHSNTGAALQDTWEWDGTNWIQAAPANAPSARGFQGMTYDAVSGKVLVFGGLVDQFNGPALGDTWTWDGVNWTQANPAGTPSARCTTLATDVVRQRVVMFSGAATIYSQATLTDTWEWDGSNWTLMSPAASPPPRLGHAMTLDALGRIVLFGGETSFTAVRADLWGWDGANWTQLRTSTGPTPRADHALAYDPVRDRVVLFGGTSAQLTPLGDTWLWDGFEWREVLPANSPAPRAAHVMTFDPVRQRVVLFGGTGRNDTWEWDGTNWQQRTPAAAPPAQTKPAMVWDSVRQRGVLYGSDTYEWDGSQWTNRPSAARPASTRDVAMAFDAVRGRVVLFGGQAFALEMWEWDGLNWTPVTMANPTPPARRTGTMVFDATLTRMFLYAGFSTASGVLGDTWDWDNTAWTNRTLTPAANNPPMRLSHAMVHDPSRQRSILFGGSNAGQYLGDTWELAAANPARYAPFGAGCAGGAGMPVLGAVPWQLPWLGGSFTAEVRPIPPVAVGVMFTGYSRTTWLGIPLPLNLTGAGMPGCSLLASGQIILALSTGGGVGTLTLPLPTDPSLLGAAFYQQALVSDFAANPAGLIVSNGAAARFGQR